MITLDATLKTAQDGLSHHPICKIVSKGFLADIPFDGNFFNEQTVAEGKSYMIAHSSGRMVFTFKRGNDLYLMFTDAARTTWSEQSIYDGDATGHPVQDAAAVELTNGNLGIVFVALESGTYYLYAMIVGPTGTVVSAPAQISSGATAIRSPALCPTSSGFLLVYSTYSGTPSNYYLHKRTADANFTNWAAAADIALTGLTLAWEKDNPALLKAASGRVYCFFDYVDAVEEDNVIRNVYYIYSTDNGVNWSAPAVLTDYADFTRFAAVPSVSEKSNGDIVVSYHEQISVLTIDQATSDWCNAGDVNDFGQTFYDATSEKLYVVCSRYEIGLKGLIRVLVIDYPTWTIEKCYHQAGSPGWNTIFSDGDLISCQTNNDAKGGYIALAFGSAPGLLLIDHNTETVKEYHFFDDAPHGTVKNIDITDQEHFYLAATMCQIDIATGRLYLAWAYEHVHSGEHFFMGYVELDEQANPITGQYTWHPIIDDWNSATSGVLLAFDWSSYGQFRIYPDEGMAIFSCWYNLDTWRGGMWVFLLASGSLYKFYDYASMTGFQYRGYGYPVLKNNIIYASVMHYEALYGSDEYRGLALINLATDTITHERPTYATLDNYSLVDLQLIDDGTRIIMGSPNGVVIYDISAKTWTLYDNTNVSGFQPSQARAVAYNASDGVAFAAPTSDGLAEALYAFATGGALYRGKYITGTVSGDAYIFAADADLHLTHGGYDLTVSHGPDDSLWNVWTHFDYEAGEYSLKWDKDGMTPDVSDYIMAGMPVEIAWEVDKLTTAKFALARGDLFDPTNTMSVYAPLFRKGRLVEIYLGEKVAGVDYWQKQATLVVDAATMRYSKTEHPTIEISCADRAAAWSELVVTATAGYRNETLENVLDDLLEDIGNLAPEDHIAPILTNDHGLYIQWVDESLADILEEIASHFGVFQRWNENGVLKFVPIDLAAAVAHDYTGQNVAIINYSPDDRYSSYINRVIVKCEGQEFLEVLWDLETIGTESGTLGWWSKEATIKFWYSKDHTRRCRYPELDVIQSINDYSPMIKLLGGKGSEEITATDADETWCEITLEAPDRAIYVFAFAGAVAAFGAMAIYCDYEFGCGAWIMATNLALSALISVIAATASYRYDIWAYPIGHEKQTYQAIADDLDFQNDLGGMVVPHEIEDPLSYTVQHCQMVAAQELAVVKAQRKRIFFEKVAHLQDEIGDVIRIPHPVNQLTSDVFIAKVIRTFTRPSVSGGGGVFSDRIDAWRVA